jgi:hypothetical protein
MVCKSQSLNLRTSSNSGRWTKFSNPWVLSNFHTSMVLESSFCNWALTPTQMWAVLSEQVASIFPWYPTHRRRLSNNLDRLRKTSSHGILVKPVALERNTWQIFFIHCPYWPRLCTKLHSTHHTKVLSLLFNYAFSISRARNFRLQDKQVDDKLDRTW